MKRRLLIITVIAISVLLCGCQDKIENPPVSEEIEEVIELSPVVGKAVSPELTEIIAETTPSPEAQGTPAPNLCVSPAPAPSVAPTQIIETTPEPSPEIDEEAEPSITPVQETDISEYIAYAVSYGKSIGLIIDDTATDCWDNPISASSAQVKADIAGRLDWYVADGVEYFCVWQGLNASGNSAIYIGYA